MNYLTDKDYETANLNGIDNANVYNRVYHLKWDIERAVTQPLRRKEDALWPKYKELAEKTGISKMRFYQRTYEGMTPEEAATKPKVPRGDQFRIANAKVTRAIIETAEKNGISEKTLKMRVYMYKWDVERAMTEHIHTQMMAKLSEEQVIEIYKRAHNGENQQKLADEFKLERATINKIKLGQTWSWLTKEI